MLIVIACILFANYRALAESYSYKDDQEIVYFKEYAAVVGNEDLLWIYTNHYDKKNRKLGVFATTLRK